jgi:hypothetical protein
MVEAFRAWFWLVVPTWAEPWRGFLRGLFFLVVEFGYPLFRYPTVALEPLCECGHSCRGSVSHELES